MQTTVVLIRPGGTVGRVHADSDAASILPLIAHQSIALGEVPDPDSLDTPNWGWECDGGKPGCHAYGFPTEQAAADDSVRHALTGI